jgi:hypothetical protein
VRNFVFYREEDVSGVSGTGVVAEVVEFASGKVVVSFLPHTAGIPNVIVYDSLEDAIAIHGHGGRTLLMEEQRDGQDTGTAA